MDGFEGIIEKSVWLDEANFKLSGTVNRHNFVNYATENPHVTREKALNQHGVTVWAGLCPNGMIGPVFFLNYRYKDTIRD